MTKRFLIIPFICGAILLLYSCSTTGTREEYFGYSRPQKVTTFEFNNFSAEKNYNYSSTDRETSAKYYIYNYYNVPWWDIYSDGFYYRTPGIYISYYYYPDYYWFGSWRRHYYRHYYLYPYVVYYYDYPYYYYQKPKYYYIEKKEKSIRDFGPSRGRYTYDNLENNNPSASTRSSRTGSSDKPNQKQIKEGQNNNTQPTGEQNSEQQEARSKRLPINNTPPPNIESNSSQPAKNVDSKSPSSPPPASKPSNNNPSGGSGSNTNEDQRSRRR